MQNSQDQHRLVQVTVKHAVTAMHHAAHARAVFGPCRADVRMLRELQKDFLESARIGISDIGAKFTGAVGVDLDQIGARCRTQPYLNHAARGARE